VKEVMGLVDDKANGFNFLILYMNGECSIVSRTEAHAKCPQEIIQYYEDNLHWTDLLDKKKEDNETAEETPSSQIVSV
jgi:Chromo shadow domain